MVLVFVSVSKLFYFGIKKYRIRYKKIWYRKSIRFGIEKSIGFGKEIFGIKKSRIRYQKRLSKHFCFVCLKHSFVKFGIGIGIGFKTFPFWYKKKHWTRYQKNLVWEKVSDLVLFRFWLSSHSVCCEAICVANLCTFWHTFYRSKLHSTNFFH